MHKKGTLQVSKSSLQMLEIVMHCLKTKKNLLFSMSHKIYPHEMKKVKGFQPINT